MEGERGEGLSWLEGDGASFEEEVVSSVARRVTMGGVGVDVGLAGGVEEAVPVPAVAARIPPPWDGNQLVRGVD